MNNLRSSLLLLTLFVFSLGNASISACEDATGRFHIAALGDLRNCKYVRNKNKELCSEPEVKDACQKTCDSCGPCKDHRGKFFISDIGTIRNCQYVKSQDKDLCSIDIVKKKCKETCDWCSPTNESTNQGDDPLLNEDDFCNNDKGKFYIPEIRQLKNCRYIKNHDLALCDNSLTVAAKCRRSCNTCHLDPSLAEDSCKDQRGKFRVTALQKGPDGKYPKKNCQYVKRQNTQLCDSWRVKNKCPRTCNLC